MLASVEKAAAYLQKLEADRLSAIAASEEKAEEAKLIKARQEGFRQAMEMLGIERSVITESGDSRSKRRKRRNIPGLILNELSFTGNAMTANQIAAAIGYLPERTEKALKSMESSGQIMRDADGRWAAVVTTVAQPNGHAAATGS
jgi:DNA-binding LacI/PurR family transcriptional regulator